jgi:hypothetical protein
MTCRLVAFAVLIFVLGANVEIASGQTPGSNDNSEARPSVTKVDLKIAQRAQEILNSPAKWNRADNRVCPEDAKTFSLYCALEAATKQVTGSFEHRGAAMQEARFVIDDIAPNAKNYHHRLMDYNNDPTTTFADVQRFFKLLEERISLRLKQESSGHHE